MTRVLRLSLAAFLALAAGAAIAGPKGDSAATATCTKGQGTAVCCKAFVANHCTYVSCCEVGNSAFFTKKECGKCADHTAKRAAKASASCGTSASCSASKSECAKCAGGDVAGNRAFFTATAGCAKGDGCADKKGQASASACCAGKTAKR